MAESLVENLYRSPYMNSSRTLSNPMVDDITPALPIIDIKSMFRRTGTRPTWNSASPRSSVLGPNRRDVAYGTFGVFGPWCVQFGIAGGVWLSG